MRLQGCRASAEHSAAGGHPPSPDFVSFLRTATNMTDPNAARTVSRIAPARQPVGQIANTMPSHPAAQTSSSRQPRLQTTVRSGPNDGVKFAPTPSPLSRHQINTLGTLRDLLDDLNRSRTLGSGDVIHLFANLKAAEKCGVLPQVIRDHPKARELARVNKALMRFLHRLNAEMNTPKSADALDCSAWTVEQLRTVFLGLAACANPVCGPIFSRDQLEEVCPSLQGVNDALMRLVAGKQLPDRKSVV